MLEDWIQSYEVTNRKLNVRVVWEPRDFSASVYDSKTGKYLTAVAIITGFDRPFISIEEFTKYINTLDWQTLLSHIRPEGT
jgi:hypothetical protein